MRMGADKALQPLGGKPVIAHVLERMDALVDHIYVVANDVASYSFLGVPAHSLRRAQGDMEVWKARCFSTARPLT